ncbi:MAG: dihydrodipicolinate synthase family protein, partial [Xanthomonadales bacterium]|nr:dihydrodipicolinate synthase family protein [Xanthomonadales bacterium]
MSELTNWRGVFPAVTTKFNNEGEIDLVAMGEHLEMQLEAGVHGIIVLGSLGENSTLDMAEKRDIIRYFSERIDGRVPLLACIAESGTREALALLKGATDDGADGFMLLPPMRYASDQRETLEYLSTIGLESSLPIMLYNNPIAYGTDLLPADFSTLSTVESFVAIKESAADPRRFADIRRECGDRYALFCGVDDLAFECFAMGAVGWVAGLVVAFPRETVRLFELMRAGEWDQARKIYEWFLPLLHLDIGPKFVQQIKLVEALHGVGTAAVRAPRLALSEK